MLCTCISRMVATASCHWLPLAKALMAELYMITFGLMLILNKDWAALQAEPTSHAFRAALQVIKLSSKPLPKAS